MAEQKLHELISIKLKLTFIIFITLDIDLYSFATLSFTISTII